MEAYQERVVTECDELTERLGKLVAFIGSPTARELDEQTLVPMLHQASIMLELQRVLVLRIRGFDTD